MIKYLILSIIIFFGFLILILGFFLQPNDLINCQSSPDQKNNCSIVDAIVSISGGDTRARAEKAIELYKNGWSKKLIFSGAAQDKLGPSNAMVMKNLALEAGVNSSDIYIDENAENTKQNAQNTQTIFADNGIKSIILVTSGYHQRRASLEFQKKAESVKILNSPVINDKDWSLLWWLTPYGWWLAIGELFKIMVFYISGILV